jgi:hypothetical protein
LPSLGDHLPGHVELRLLERIEHGHFSWETGFAMIGTESLHPP